MDTFACEFDRCAQKYPENNSILYCDHERVINKILYKDLLALTNQILAVLKQFAASNSCIGVVIVPNPILPAILLSVQKHKSAFYCIDLKFFDSEICNRIGIKWILKCDESNILNTNYSLIHSISLLSYKLELWQTNYEAKLYKDIAYVIQTSGTTGVSKIVKVFHDCIMSNIKSFRTIFKITENDLIYFGTPITFDPFVIELMLALTNGACLIIVPYYVKINHKLLLKTLFPVNNKIHSGVTILQMPPSLFLNLSKPDTTNLLRDNSSLRILALGGEEFPLLSLKNEHIKHGLDIFNLYGITEVSCWSSVAQYKPEMVKISVGDVLDDTVFQLRDVDGNCTDGEGELFIGSTTRVCIIDDERPSNDIVFRCTGDIVRKECDQFYYVGRKNTIIKRYGHKVYLSQIETQVYEISQLQSVCIWDDKTLILFVVVNEHDKLVQNKIIDRLRTKFLHTLPPSHNPDIIQIIPATPLTNNGKIDKECLIKISMLNHLEKNMKPDEIFLNLCSKYFGMSSNELEARKAYTFFELGGNSILAIQIITEFDALVENNISNDLMGLLLDRLTTFEVYYNFIKTSNHCIPINEHSITNKRLKLRENDGIINEDTAELTVLWRYNMNACVDSTPIYFEHSRLGSLIAIGNHANIFVILNALNGAIISKTVLPDAIEGSACIWKEYAIIGCNNGYLYKINVENGEINWIFKTKSSIKSTPILSCESNIIFGSYDKNLYCINVDNATLIWKLEISESIKSNAIICNEVAYISSILGTCLCISIKQGIIIWKQEVKTAIFGQPCLLDHNLILWADVKGHVHCFDKTTGDKRWQYQVSGSVYSSICQFGNKILFGCFNHYVYCFECTKEKCVEVFKINIGERVSSMPYIFSFENQRYFVVSNNKGTLHVFDFETGGLCQKICLAGDVFSSPIVCNNRIYIGCRDNNIYCLQCDFKR